MKDTLRYTLGATIILIPILLFVMTFISRDPFISFLLCNAIVVALWWGLWKYGTTEEYGDEIERRVW